MLFCAPRVPRFRNLVQSVGRAVTEECIGGARRNVPAARNVLLSERRHRERTVVPFLGFGTHVPIQQPTRSKEHKQNEHTTPSGMVTHWGRVGKGDEPVKRKREDVLRHISGANKPSTAVRGLFDLIQGSTPDKGGFPLGLGEGPQDTGLPAMSFVFAQSLSLETPQLSMTQVWSVGS